MKKYFVLIAFLFSTLSTLKPFGLHPAKYDLECEIENRKKRRGYGQITLRNKNFTEACLCHMALEDISFYKANLHKANLQNTTISDCDFEKANLTNADFSWSEFYWNNNLTKAKSVKGADFYKVKGLSNKTKDFLREHGAINVPENTTLTEDVIAYLKRLVTLGVITYSFYKLVIETH
jgi:hypothetical protein